VRFFTLQSEEANETRIHIQLRNVPRTAIPSDIRRLVSRTKLQGVADVAVDYHRFSPTGRAYLTLTNSDYLRPNLTALQKSHISTFPIKAMSSSPPNNGPPSRMRGAKGRTEAVNRGIITGNGPHGGMLNPSRNVVIWGLPGRLTRAQLRDFLKDCNVPDTDESRMEIVKLHRTDDSFSIFSRHLVRLQSMALAHHLVRLLHMTYFEEGKWGRQYQIRARVIY